MAKAAFSKRNKPPAATLSHEIPERVRWRILHTLGFLAGKDNGRLNVITVDALTQACTSYGMIDASNDNEPAEKVAQSHFLQCENEKAVDFIEWMFQSDWYKSQQRGVDEVNDLL